MRENAKTTRIYIRCVYDGIVQVGPVIVVCVLQEGSSNWGPQTAQKHGAGPVRGSQSSVFFPGMGG